MHGYAASANTTTVNSATTNQATKVAPVIATNATTGLSDSTTPAQLPAYGPVRLISTPAVLFIQKTRRADYLF